ncbi:hypothetical protein SASPL_119406 [Salvia splendens]|uniref:Uncharacterized protein n=1 Tax=Salvia splendens TaxID=180675 RepID=A0A8X8ZUD2_SALSN|nr:hypothetical protein SASPL_119406 [Salvia splendens]
MFTRTLNMFKRSAAATSTSGPRKPSPAGDRRRPPASPQPGFPPADVIGSLDPVVVSSFNVSNAFHKATAWETTLSLDGNFRKLDLSRDGKKLILHGMFGMEEDVENQVVNLDMVMESNTLRIVKMHSSEVEIKSFLMIICEDLKIEFYPLTKRFGTLIESGKSCRVQVCPIEPHPLYDGVDKCN